MTHPAVGHRIPGGTFRVEGYERDVSHAALGAPPLEAPLLHPVWIVLGALRGMGATLGEVLAHVEASEHGTLFGEASFEQRRPLEADAEYRVEGEIADVVRRHGRRAGPFDVVTLRLAIADRDGDAAVVTQSFIVPRPADG